MPSVRAIERAALLCCAAALSPAVSAILAAEDVAARWLYRADWRFWRAGDIGLSYIPPPAPGQPWRAELTLKTRGFVDSLYRVDDRYWVQYDEAFCAQASLFRISEGGKRRELTVSYQQPPGKVAFRDRDLVRGTVVNTKLITVPPCVHDELAALARLRTMRLEPGQTTELPVSNGRKFGWVRVEAQQRETVKTTARVHQTIRYEAFLFNNVLYRRGGRLLLWLTDDDRRLPVQAQVRLGVALGTITIQILEDEEERR